jgi:hypothetical protein
MAPVFKPSTSIPDVTAPPYVALVMNCDDPEQLLDIVVSYDADGKPLSYLTDEKWDFSAYVQTKSEHSQRHAVWDWTFVPYTYRLAIQRLIYAHLFESRRTANEGIGALTTTFRCWSVLAQLCQECEIPSLSALSLPQIQGKLLEALSQRRLSYSWVFRLLSSLSIAHRYGFIRFHIVNFTKLAQKLCDQSKSERQTLAIPHMLAAQIYAHAIARIERWHRKRNQLARFFGEYLDLIEQKATKETFDVFFRNANILKQEIAQSRYRWPDTKSIMTIYNDILAACGAVIGAVSGMRTGEWYELNEHSYREETFKGITHSLLVGKTSKLNNGIPIHHAWVTAPVARLAIELLTAVSGPPRARLLKKANALTLSGQPLAAAKLVDISTSLFLSLGVVGKSHMCANLALSNGLKRLVASAPNKDGTIGAYLREEHRAEFQALNRQWRADIPFGELWPIATHQFRRTFAVFLLRNGFGSFLQVKQQFAHHNISMSIWYGRNAEVARAFDMELDVDIQAELAEINTTLMTDMAEKIYLSSAFISGTAGLNIRAQISKGCIVFESREEIEAAVRNGELTIVDNGHSLCLNPSCGRLDCTIDPVINPALCSHDVIMEQHALQRVELRKRLINRHKSAIEQGLNQPNLIAKTLVGIRACEKIMADHGIEFEPYGALIDIKMMGEV